MLTPSCVAISSCRSQSPGLYLPEMILACRTSKISSLRGRFWINSVSSAWGVLNVLLSIGYLSGTDDYKLYIIFSTEELRLTIVTSLQAQTSCIDHVLRCTQTQAQEDNSGMV